jgi:hypothetical protein
MNKLLQVSPLLVIAGLLAISASGSASAQTPEATPEESVDGVTVVYEGLFPEGIEYDATNGRFLVSSTSTGQVFTVAEDGTPTPLVIDERIPSSLGLEVDEANNRLFVVGMNYEEEAFLGIYNAESGETIAFADLAPLTPNAQMRFPNDVTVDAQGFAYVTDSVTGMIYRVDTQGNPTIFLQDERFTTDFALNGIAYNEEGNFLIAVLVPGLIKIPLDDPTNFTDVGLANPLGNLDGIVFLDENTLAVVNNREGKVLRLESSDGFASAQVTGTFATGNVFPTTVAARDGAAYVLYAQLNSEETSVTEFPIVHANFGDAR